MKILLLCAFLITGMYANTLSAETKQTEKRVVFYSEHKIIFDIVVSEGTASEINATYREIFMIDQSKLFVFNGIENDTCGRRPMQITTSFVGITSIVVSDRRIEHPLIKKALCDE